MHPAQSTGFSRAAVGAAVREITPPVGIYARSWGAARHETAVGVHRPLTATALVLRPIDGAGSDQVLLGFDAGWLPYRPDEEALQRAVRGAAGLTDETLLMNMSHTHGGANLNSQLSDKPGVELIAPYLAHLAEQLAGVISDARATLQPAWLTFGYGRCAMAANRDLWAPDLGRYVCGYNPHAAADDTVLVGRVTADDGRVIATLVNYACHPTTLAWQNQLLSPDYIGAMRETLEQIYDAPCLFLYGAAGELGPREGFVGDPAVADRNGRQLAYAAAAAIEALPPPATRFCYTGTVASGANLATWAHQPLDPAAQQRCAVIGSATTYVPLQRKTSLTPVDPPAAGAGDPIAEAEKALRRTFIRAALGDDPVYQMPLWAWRLGDALLIACPNEAYSVMQTAIRARFSGRPVLVLGCTNGTVGYLPPAATYHSGLYQEQQSPFAAGCLEQSIDAAVDLLATL
jgi:hypothetical protein